MPAQTLQSQLRGCLRTCLCICTAKAVLRVCRRTAGDSCLCGANALMHTTCLSCCAPSQLAHSVCLCVQVNYTQAVTRSLPSDSFASSSIIHKSSLLSSKNAAAFVPKRSATGNAGTAQKLQETARAKAQSVLTAPRNAMQSAKQTVSSTTNAVINQMPKPVSCWPGYCSLCMGSGQTS